MPIALLFGAGPSLTKALATSLAKRSYQVVLTGRDPRRWEDFAQRIGAHVHPCDATVPDDVARVFHAVDQLEGSLEVAAYLPSAGPRGPIATLEATAASLAVEVTAGGAFLMARQAAIRMAGQGAGALLFAGATASTKGFAESAPFAMGKFALRGLCQSLARELHPKGVHVGHVIIDGTIDDGPQDQVTAGDALRSDRLRPSDIAQVFMDLIEQRPSAWSWEVEIRPARERF